MSEYGFGVEDDVTEPAAQDQGPKWFRDQMAKVSADIKSLREENEALRAEKARTQVREALTAQGYAPQVANLYTGQPEGLNDWLAANAAALAKTGGEAAIEAEQGVQGTPQSAISAEDQAAMAKMAAAGQDRTAALGGEDQLAARLAQANTPEELAAIMRGEGNGFV